VGQTAASFFIINRVSKLVLAREWIVLAWPPSAKADECEREGIVTFSGSVEFPGQVLQPGAYVFKLLDSNSNRHIVQVFNEDENHLYATIVVIPGYRLRTSDKPAITFEERATGSPKATRAWFYPGGDYG
jgi:hypothetical protein